MRVLYYDVMQESDAPAALLSGSLAERYNFPETQDPVKLFYVYFPYPVYIDSFGIGNTDGTYFRINADTIGQWFMNGGSASSSSAYFFKGGDAFTRNYRYFLDANAPPDPYPIVHFPAIHFTENGLYPLGTGAIVKKLTVFTDATYIGRMGAGRAVHTGTAIAKSIANNNSEKGRVTLSGQRVPGVGGYNFRTLSLDTRYKIKDAEMAEIQAAYNTQIGPGLPLFIVFDTEARRIPFGRFYGIDTANSKFSFEGGINRYAFSRKFNFEECF